MERIIATQHSVTIENLETADPDVAAFFSEVPDTTMPDVMRKAISLGVVGLRAMDVAGQVALVEREFGKLADGFRSTLGEVEDQIQHRIDANFDPDEAESVSARLGGSIADAYKSANDVLATARGELEKLVRDSFNPDLTTSCVYAITKLVTETRAELDRAFDPAYEDSHLSRLLASIDDYFGASGTVEEVIAGQILPVKEEVMKALQDVRDIIVGQAAAADQRRLSSASGDDFEDKVEDLLRRVAKGYGDTVDRVGTVAGDAGRSKKGDFVVQLREGSRFVVEAKDCSRPITLRGPKGILTALDESIENRSAGFAIAVVKEEGGFPKEVGHFNDYGDDKILCHFGTAGEMLETAYRWARTVLLAEAATAAVDAEVIQAGLDEVREALREIKRIDTKAKAISQGAEDIRSMVAFQLKRATAALDRAAEGLEGSASIAS